MRHLFWWFFGYFWELFTLKLEIYFSSQKNALKYTKPTKNTEIPLKSHKKLSPQSQFSSRQPQNNSNLNHKKADKMTQNTASFSSRKYATKYFLNIFFLSRDTKMIFNLFFPCLLLTTNFSLNLFFDNYFCSSQNTRTDKVRWTSTRNFSFSYRFRKHKKKRISEKLKKKGEKKIIKEKRKIFWNFFSVRRVRKKNRSTLR